MMKRALAMLIALLLALCAAGTALCESMSYLDYTDDILPDGRPIYYFPELSLTLPAQWSGKVMAIAEEGRTAFYQKASYEAFQKEGIPGGGFLFALGAAVNSDFQNLPAFRYIGFSEASAMNYYLELPTDSPAYGDPAIREEYDAMLAQVDRVAEDAEIYQNSGSAGDTASQAQGAPTLQSARYHFEHSTLPRYFYDDPANMLDVLEQNGIYRLWTILADENHVDYPYLEGDYAQQRYTLQDGTTLLQVVMPRPEAGPLCYRVYFIYNAQSGLAGYYTVEREDLLGETALLCGWTADLQHVTYGGAAMLESMDDEAASALREEALQIAALSGASAAFAEEGPSAGSASEDAELAEIPCPELGFTTRADPAYAWDYQEGTGITIYTGAQGSIPYVIVWQSEDLIGEPFEYIREQYTPHIQAQYGDRLVSFEEVEAYDFGVKTLPAGLYSYMVQDTQVDMIRAYDSTGARTVAYTVKVIHGQEEPTLTALRDAMRYFRAD